MPVSRDEQDLEMGRLHRQVNERHQQLTAMIAKLRRIGESLYSVSQPLRELDKDIYGNHAMQAKNYLEIAAKELDVTELQKLLADYLTVKDEFVPDQAILRQYGPGPA
jgi:hypothetical protein